MYKNQRVFILGPNGCGKSTLLKIITGKIDDFGGNFSYGYNVNFGYYDQELGGLDLENTLIDEVWMSNEDLTQTQIRNALAMFLFKGEDVLKTVGSLSGGEKSRIALIKLMLSEANLLILDEPTNHLDINSKEVLENSLLDFDGTLIVVSHDRYFVNKLATRIIELGTDTYLDYDGNYDDFKQYKVTSNITAFDNKTTVPKVPASKLEHIMSKEEKARKRKLERQTTKVEKEISIAETHIKDIESQMALDEITCDHIKLMELDKELKRMEKKLEKLYTVWDGLLSEH